MSWNKTAIYRPFFFMETTVTITSHLDILQHVTVPQLQQDTDSDLNNTHQQNGAPLQSKMSQWQIYQIG